MTVETLFHVAMLVLMALVLVYLHRLLVGPTVFDRILGFAGFGTKTTIVLLFAGAVYGRLEMFVDLALAYAILSFVGSLAAARYFERGGSQR